MGNARLFFDIRKRIKKIRWESRKSCLAISAGSFGYVRINIRFP